MKTYVALGRVLATLITVLASTTAPSLYSQSGITIVGGTRITDCTTGELIPGGFGAGAFTAAIYWAPGTVTDRAQFLQLGGYMPTINGTLQGGARPVPAPQQSTISLFAAAWETSAGASYHEALQVFGAKVGASDILTAVLDDSAVRFPDFEVCPVPEPSTWAFLCLGLLAVGLRYKLRRRD